MKREVLIWTVGALVFVLMGVWLVLWVLRWKNEAVLRAQWSATETAHFHLVHQGQEYARTLLELQTLAYARSLEAHLSQPWSPWWPRRPHGSYEPVPFWHQTYRSRQIRLDAAIRSRQEFQTQIGATNQQSEAALFKRLVELRKQKETESQPATAPYSEPAARSPQR